jgi:hypothetical protein
VRESPLVTLVMIQAGDDAQSVNETKKFLTAGLPIDVSSITTDENSLVDGPLEESDIVWTIVSSFEAFDLASVETPYLGLVHAGDLLSASSLARRVAALHRHPEIVLSACAASDRHGQNIAIHPLQSIGDQSEARCYDHPGSIDGRSFALDILHNGGWPLVAPSTFLVRRSALGAGDYPEVSFQLGQILLLLTRGEVWHDPFPGVATPVADHDQLERWEQWPTIIAEAARLGLLEDQGHSQALISHARTGAALLRHFWAEGDDPIGRLVSGVDDLVMRWTLLERKMAAPPGPLPLRVAIQAAETPVRDAVTREALRGLVPEDQISEIRSFGDQPLSDGPDDVPTLVLHSGERLEVLDRGQFESILSGRYARSTHISTPDGVEPRLRWSAHGSVAVGGEMAIDGSPVHSAVVRSVDAGDFARWLPPADRRELPDTGLTFVIAAPDYTDRHAGVVALHRLCDRLNVVGFRAYIEPLGEAVGITRDDWITPLWWRKDFENTIVVYPEIVTGNPLGAPNVVRWILNRPSWFTGSPMDPHVDDLIFSFSPQIDPHYPILGLPLIDPTVFFPKDVPGHGSLLWIGKGVLPVGFDASDVTLITGEWPPTRKDFASLLRGADVLYSCDWLTAVIGEALMCSTPVVLLGPQDWPADEVVLWPGMTWDHQDDLAGARHRAASFYQYYMGESLVVNGAVADFALQAIRHFG